MAEKFSIPQKYQPEKMFLDILSYDAHHLFNVAVHELETYGYNVISKWHAEHGYIYAKGTLPVCLCAHMDKVPWYKPVKKISKTPLLDSKNKVVDCLLSSKQGIGGDDRCGVYAIFKMLQLGHRPSIIFSMGEEIGTRGAKQFTVDFQTIDNVNAFIQIDRRGSKDVVCYTDDNDALTNAVIPFGYNKEIGSCTDISVYMPHFGISGVNISSGYYNEHSAEREYVSVKTVNSLLKKLNNILNSNIFDKLYVYRSRSYSYHSTSTGSRFSGYSHGYYQPSLLDGYDYIDQNGDAVDAPTMSCEYCGNIVYETDMIEAEGDFINFVCPDCAKELVDNFGYTQCQACHKLYMASDDADTKRYGMSFCPFCGCGNDTDKIKNL